MYTGAGCGEAMHAIHAPNAADSRGAGYAAMRALIARIAPPSVDAPP
ncbi:hypothetical protein BURMUCGD2M_5200 [Burkholderia multivorans CGD2M]|uniref:Uncharacterized protein n=1 Tax=Burkholderia multivorans CGD2 TaxID=513052 RepID=B9BJF1_9BURK|nr:hypothetical protein BURMUCGD2_5207 [Burkholderia multivorans CGD2]EEE15757.1 hypothetical protein BURMUCGD2M_5200 [Burkholderia multivorans CGD2M]